MAGRPRALARNAALVALGTLVLTAIVPAASAQPPSGPAPTAAQTLGADKPSAQVLRALERDLRLTPTQASARLVNEAEAGTRAGILHNALGTRFAGAWVKGATSTQLSVATTSRADFPLIRAQGAEPTLVRWTLNDLRTAQSKLDKAAAHRITADTPVWYTDARTNRVVVEARSRSAATAFVKAAGVAADRTRVLVTANRPRLLKDLVGGDAYYIDASARCSIGFSVTKGTTQGFATAGHCGKPGAKTTGYDQTDQGTFRASTFPGKDMAWVGVNANWTATPDVKADNGQTVQVAGSAEAVIGASVCRSGSTSGWHCGTIQQTDVTVDYAEGTVNGLTQTDVCAEPGDSGGPYISGAQAQGTTSGGSGDCTSGGTTFFQPINATLSDFGLTLKTTAQTAASQSPGTTGAWSTGRVYRVGATVTHGQARFRCLRTHQAQSAWAPDATPALWQRL
ncbi:trypsin-like serine protease [Streptomyces gilvus]|uniref:trypsin-like serine protease n=1 Tax=Streptomyces gilvus TaxID=2920937 RepID=UPI001F0D0E68|nr:alpha-lytic protease prodomain-containing protein [Streptomyces sp. CME 23]MCH5677003.1 alpha-lytic protease prodomain-containing protein [Streptomyces sp. CME 23]